MSCQELHSGNAGHGDTIHIASDRAVLGLTLHVLQAVRNLDDLTCMACPPKYRQMNTFYKYYSGQLTAPVLTIFSEHCRLPHNSEVKACLL